MSMNTVSSTLFFFSYRDYCTFAVRVSLLIFVYGFSLEKSSSYGLPCFLQAQEVEPIANIGDK